MKDGDMAYLEGWRDGIIAFSGNVPPTFIRPKEEELDYLVGFKDAVQFMKEGLNG